MDKEGGGGRGEGERKMEQGKRREEARGGTKEETAVVWSRAWFTEMDLGFNFRVYVKALC